MHADKLFDAYAFATAFYARVAQDPILRPFFPSTFRCAVEQFAAFLVQLFDGPEEHMQKRWWLSLRESHARLKLGPRERDSWMRQMSDTLAEFPMEESTRRELRKLFETASTYIVDERIRGEGERWNAQLLLEDTVAAIRSGEVERSLALVNDPQMRARFERNRSVHAHVLALMCGSGSDRMIAYVQQELLHTPELVTACYAGRTLLHSAAGAGSLAIVELLLKLGANPNVLTSGGHAPLYCVGNECKIATGGDVVRALVRAGAKVDAADGVQRCTALHMAARRGNVDVARALLECGASSAARDRNGATPLRRALNCRKPAVAELFTNWSRA